MTDPKSRPADGTPYPSREPRAFSEAGLNRLAAAVREPGIHSAANACMFRDECRSRDNSRAEMQRLRDMLEDARVIVSRYLSTDPVIVPALTKAASDVLAERVRQVEVERQPHHQDDAYDDFELERASACYALAEAGFPASTIIPSELSAKRLWPWEWRHWKPKTHRANLVRAAALALAAIEKIDRAAAEGGKA